MQNSNSFLQLGSIEALVVYKPIKNLHLTILPPNGRVRISAPLDMNENAIRTMLALRLPWIKKQQLKYKTQARQTKREYISGESVYFFGKKYKLEIIHKNEAPAVYIKGKTKIILQVRSGVSVNKKSEIFNDWLRGELKPIIAQMVEHWKKKLNVQVEAWQIKQMKTRWGTCNNKKQTILFNLELAKKPVGCIEYVVLHELAHLIERSHNDKFIKILDDNLPKWRSLKADLNRFILSYQKWDK
jgi:predicted metal-dependent hydrolase